MSYGKVRLSLGDRSFIREILDRRASALPARRDAATSEPERAFYTAAIDGYAQLSAKLGRATAGKTSFSENELRTLRSALFGSEKPELAKAYRVAIESGDKQAKASLAERLARIEALDGPLGRPFELDRSQDAEDDEEPGDEDELGD